MNAPRLRFNEFTDPWETAKIKDYLTESRIPGSKGDTAKKISVKRWGKGVVEKHTVHDGSDNTQYYIRKEGQFIYGKLDFLLGSLGIVPKELDGFESTLDSPAFDISPEIYPYYLDYYTQREKFYLGYGNIANGSRKARRVHAEDFYEMPLIFPTIDEQKKIASFFLVLNKKIDLQQEKISLLKEMKKGYMQKIFNQTLRFKDKEGQQYPDWESKELSKYLSVNVNYNKKLLYDANDVLSVSGEHGIVNQIEFQGRSFAGANLDKYKIVNVGEIVYTKSPLKDNPYGIIKANLYKTGIVSTLYAVYSIIDQCCDPKFIQYYFESKETINKYLRPIISKGAKNTINISDQGALENKVTFPSLEEQKRISSFLYTFDLKLTKEYEKLNTLEQQKQAFIQQMFI